MNPTSQRRQPFSQWRAWFVVLPLILSLLGMLLVSALHEGSLVKTHAAASWTEIWQDEFNGAANTGADSAWQYDTGTNYPGAAANWGTHEVESYTNSTANVSTDGNGHLAITPVKSNNTWTSGRIESVQNNFAAPQGGELQVTASIQLPNVTGTAAQGYWPAFWLLGTAFRGNYNNWPSVGEIDIMENVNGNNSVFGTLHCGVIAGGPCNETTGLSGSTSCGIPTCQGGFHTYTVIMDRSTSPEEIRWYLDGTEYWHVDANTSGMDATTWANAVDHGFFILLNVAIGGDFPGSPTASTASGASMLVNYVRVYTSPT